MTPEDYQNEANRTESIIDKIEGYDKTRLIHGMLGLTSESGEIADTLKRWLYYSQPLDEDNLKEEIGDLLWYVALLCNTLGIQMSDCMESNIRKLRKRFPEKFDIELAKEENRDRESEMEAVTQEKTPECKFKVGQVWENADRDRAEILALDDSFEYCTVSQPIKAMMTGSRCGINYFTADGYLGTHAGDIDGGDLIKLISEPAEEATTDEETIEPEQGSGRSFAGFDLHSGMKHYQQPGKDAGISEVIQIARDVADMLDGQDRKQALRMIEQRVNSPKDQN